MAFATLADLFKNNPEVTEGMEDVARRSFPSKLPEYGNELTAEQIDALNNDPKLLDEFTKSKATTAPKIEPTFQSKIKPTDYDPSVAKSNPVSSSKQLAVIPNQSKDLSVIEKLHELPEEQLSMFGKLGEAIKNSKALRLAGKVAGPLGAGLEANAGIENLSEGKYPEAAGNALGAVSGVAATMGSPMAAPLGMASLGIAGGMSQGRQQAETGIDEMGIESVPADQTFSGSQRQLTPMEMETQERGNPLANNMSAPPPAPPSPVGMGPMANPDDYNPSVNPMVEEDVGDMGGDTSMLVGKEVAEQPIVNPNQEELDRLIAMQGTMGTLENLRAAQNRASDNRASADIMSAGAKFGAGLSGAISKLAPPKVDTEIADNLRKDADRPVTNLKEQLEMEKDDPNSAYSKNLRDFATPLAKKVNVILPANISGRQLASLIPGMESMYERSLKREELAQEKEKTKLEKSEKTNNDWISKVTNQTKGFVDAYSKSKLAANAVRSLTGKNPAEDVTVLYSFVKGLDPDSTVREGEVQLAQSMISLAGKGEVLMNKIKNGDVVDKKTVDNLKNEILRLESDAKNIYTNRLKPFKEQAKARKIDEDSFSKQIDPYYELPKTKSTTDSTEEVSMGGKRYLVDHNTKKVLKEIK